MIGEQIALLFGLFGAPLVLLYLGHRLRDHGPRAKRRFWGGVIGYIAGMLISTTAMLEPPVFWAGAGLARDFAIHWSMLIGLLLGLISAPFPTSSPPTPVDAVTKTAPHRFRAIPGVGIVQFVQLLTFFIVSNRDIEEAPCESCFVQRQARPHWLHW